MIKSFLKSAVLIRVGSPYPFVSDHNLSHGLFYYGSDNTLDP